MINPDTLKTVKRIVLERVRPGVTLTRRSTPIKLGDRKLQVLINPSIEDTENNIGGGGDQKAAETLRQRNKVREAYNLYNKIIIERNSLKGRT